MTVNNIDQVTLVNENDEVLGSIDKVEAHRGEAKRHRAISVYLFKKPNNSTTQQHNNVELLIQQRSAKKIVGAGQWANTVCGNVRPNESYEECAYRRLQEELGIDILIPMKGDLSADRQGKPSVSVAREGLQPLHKFEYHIQCNEEFSEWEMDQVFVGWYDGPVKQNLDEVQDYQWVNWKNLIQHSRDFTLAPWFIWMLKDKKLIKKIDIYAKS